MRINIRFCLALYSQRLNVSLSLCAQHTHILEIPCRTIVICNAARWEKKKKTWVPHYYHWLWHAFIHDEHGKWRPFVRFYIHNSILQQTIRSAAHNSANVSVDRLLSRPLKVSAPLRLLLHTHTHTHYLMESSICLVRLCGEYFVLCLFYFFFCMRLRTHWKFHSIHDLLCISNVFSSSHSI